MPAVAVVIRTFNEEKHLPALFDALDGQRLGDFETIVVDSGSYDRTREIAAERADRLVRIAPQDFTFGHSLNVGIKAAGAPLAAMVSAHTVPEDPSWLERLVAPFSDPNVAMVFGRQKGGAPCKFSEKLDFERLFGTEPKVLKPPHFFANNANAAIRRELWSEHPFDETLPGFEDIEWAKHWMERGRQVVYEPRACLFHIHEETWPQVRRRHYREAQAAKWLGTFRRRDIPRKIAFEALCLAKDLGRALAAAQVGELGGIARYRYEKLAGCLGGVWDGALMENPLRRRRHLFDRTYKGVVIRGPGQAALEDLERPELAPSEVLVRVAYQGVCATDLEILEGSLGYYKKGEAKYPIVPGHEFSGVVAAAGPRVENLKEGDRVVVECIQGCGDCPACRAGNPIGCSTRREVGVIGRDGGYAEYMTTPGRFVHRLPAGLSLQAAALCEPMAVVLKALGRLEAAWGPAKRRACAVVGAGTIGHLAARVLEKRGHSVTVIDRNQKRLELFSGTTIQTRDRLTELGNFDALVEATGNPDVLDRLVGESRPGAAILLLGLPYGLREFNFESLVAYDKTVVGSVGSGPDEFRAAISLLAELDLARILSEALPLADYEKAWGAFKAGDRLKVMLRAGGEA